MRARPSRLTNVVPYALTLLLAAGLPAHAAAQAQSRRDTTAEPTPPVKDLPLTAAQRQAYVGRYSGTLPFGEETSLRVVEENGVLKAGEDAEGKRLLYQGDNMFRPEGVPGFVLTFVLENGRATRIVICRQDGVMQAVRVP